MYRPMMLFFALMCSPVMAAAQQPCTSDARPVVNELYRHMLERNADARSNYWVQQLQSGQTVKDLVREFAKSDEHVERFWRQESGEATPYLRAMSTFYRHILGVQLDATTARTFANQATRRGLDPVIDQIVDSAEYTQRFGDWGVPGSGGLQYCGPNSGPNNRTFNANPDTDPADQADRTRFEDMDVNNDGVVSRREWRGTPVAFENQDWNDDGLLSGAELEPAEAQGRGRGRGRGQPGQSG